MYYLCFLLIFICSNPTVQRSFSRLLGNETQTEVSGFLLAVLCCSLLLLTYYISQKDSKEPFYFEVSKFKPSCHGLYRGRPTSFQYDRIGCDRNRPVGDIPNLISLPDNQDVKSYCKENKNPPLGHVFDENTPLYGNEHKFF